MNAVVMDQAVVGEASIIAAMAFVKAGMAIAPRSLVVGAPARVLRTLTDAEIDQKSFGTRQYQRLTTRCLQTMQAVQPLDRKSVVKGKSVSVRVDHGGRRIIKKKK